MNQVIYPSESSTQASSIRMANINIHTPALQLKYNKAIGALFGKLHEQQQHIKALEHRIHALEQEKDTSKIHPTS